MHTCPPSGVRSWAEFHQLVSGVGVFHLVNDYRPDDVILFCAPDEIMSSDYLIYLKVHTGLPEPYVVSVRRSLLGLRLMAKTQDVKVVGSSVKYLVSVCRNQAIDLQFDGCDDAKNGNVIARYHKFDTKNIVKRWKTAKEYAAWWRCRWCLPSSSIRKHIDEIYERTGIRVTIQRSYSALTNSTVWTKQAKVEDSKKAAGFGWAGAADLPRFLRSENRTDEYAHLLTGNFTHFDYHIFTPFGKL